MPKLVFYIGVGGQSNVCIIMILFCGMSSLSHSTQTFLGLGTHSFTRQSPRTSAWEATCMACAEPFETLK